MMNKSKFFLIALLFLFSYSVYSISPDTQKEVDDIREGMLRIKAWDIKAFSDKNSGIITGTLQIQSLSDNYGNDIRLYASLLTKDESYIIDNQALQGSFSLKPREIITKSFTYIPSLIPKGEYKLRIQLQEGSGREIDWVDGAITFEQGQPLLLIQSPHIRIGRNVIGSQEGPIVFSPADATIKLTISNPSLEDITAVPTFEVREFDEFGMLAAESSAENDVFLAGEQREVSYPLPYVKNPGTYIAVLRYYDLQGQPISGPSHFRFLIPGATARILSLSQKGDSFAPPKGMEIIASISGPPDLSLLEGTSLIYQLQDGKGKIVLNGKEQLPDFSINEIKGIQFSLITKKAVPSPKLLLSVQDKDGKILSQTSKELFISQSALKKAKNDFMRKILFFITIGFILSILIFFLVKRFKGKVKDRSL